MPWLTILTSKWGLIALAAVAVAVGLVWFYLDAKAAGAAIATSAAVSEVARRIVAANKARSEARNVPMDQDPYNDDNRRH